MRGAMAEALRCGPELRVRVYPSTISLAMGDTLREKHEARLPSERETISKEREQRLVAKVIKTLLCDTLYLHFALKVRAPGNILK